MEQIPQEFDVAEKIRSSAVDDHDLPTFGEAQCLTWPEQSVSCSFASGRSILYTAILLLLTSFVDRM